MVSVYQRYAKDDVASFLTTFADSVRNKEQALLRGDVIGPASPLIAGAKATAVYVSIPVFFPEEFATYRGSEPPTVIVWLVPLMTSEISLIKSGGWERFEDKLEQRHDFDFWSLDREELAWEDPVR